MIDHQGSVGAQLKFPTQPSATDEQEVGRLREEEDYFPPKVTYLDFSKELEISTEDSTQVLEDEKKLIQVDKEEDRTDQHENKHCDQAQSDQVVIYKVIDETIKANRKKKKKMKRINEDLLVRAIKKALDEECSLAADSCTHSSVASRSDDSTIYTLESGHPSLIAFKRHPKSRDESTADVTASSDDETILSGYTEVPMTGFQNTCLWNPSPVEEQDMEDEYDYDDDDDNDDVSYDETAGFIEDVLNCGTYSFCIGDEQSCKPGFVPVASKDAMPKESDITTSPQLRNEDRKVKSKKRLESKAMQVATLKMEDVMFQEERDANELAEALEKIFLTKDGVSNDSSNYLEENTNMKNSIEQSTQTLSPTDKSIATSEANTASSTKKVKPYLLGAVKSVSSSMSFKKQKSFRAEEKPTEMDAVQPLPKTALNSVDLIRSEVEVDIDTTVQDNSEQGFQEVLSATTKSKPPLEKSLHNLKQLKGNSNLRSIRDKLTAKRPNSSKIVTAETINEDSTSSTPTVDDNAGIDLKYSDQELAAIAERQWKYATDKVTGKTYYYNKFTKEVTWKAPDGFLPKKPQWKTAFDVTTGKEYYYNRQTKEVTWKKPY